MYDWVNLRSYLMIVFNQNQNSVSILVNLKSHMATPLTKAKIYMLVSSLVNLKSHLATPFNQS